MISAHWQSPDGTWQPFEVPPAFLYQSTRNVIAMMEGFKIPVVINIDGGYICTSNMIAEIRKAHPGKQVIAFRNIKKTDAPFYRTLGLNL